MTGISKSKLTDRPDRPTDLTKALQLLLEIEEHAVLTIEDAPEGLQGRSTAWNDRDEIVRVAVALPIATTLLLADQAEVIRWIIATARLPFGDSNLVENLIAVARVESIRGGLPAVDDAFVKTFELLRARAPETTDVDERLAYISGAMSTTYLALHQFICSAVAAGALFAGPPNILLAGESLKLPDTSLLS